MRRAQNGDRQAFSLVYERYSSAVLSYLYRMLGNVEDVESIGQEVFLRAYRFAPTYRFRCIGGTSAGADCFVRPPVSDGQNANPSRRTRRPPRRCSD